MRSQKAEQMNKSELIPNDYFCAEYRERSSSFPLHGHDFYEVEYIVKGNCINVINGQEYVMQAGDFCFLCPGDLHELKVSQPIALYNLSFMAGAVREGLFVKLLAGQSGVGKILPSQNILFEQVFHALCSECQLPKTEGKEYAEGLLTVLMCQVLRQETARAERGSTPILRAIGYIHERAVHTPSLAEVAGVAGLQINYFCKAFKRATGKTYIDYLNGLKVEYATRLLSAGNVSVSEVCFSCGYSSFSQFSREFKRRTGCSPKQFVRQRKV